MVISYMCYPILMALLSFIIISIYPGADVHVHVSGILCDKPLNVLLDPVSSIVETNN